MCTSQGKVNSNRQDNVSHWERDRRSWDIGRRRTKWTDRGSKNRPRKICGRHKLRVMHFGVSESLTRSWRLTPPLSVTLLELKLQSVKVPSPSLTSTAPLCEHVEPTIHRYTEAKVSVWINPAYSLIKRLTSTALQSNAHMGCHEWHYQKDLHTTVCAYMHEAKNNHTNSKGDQDRQSWDTITRREYKPIEEARTSQSKVHGWHNLRVTHSDISDS